MDREAVQAWLDKYIAAWRTYDAQHIGELFSEDALYRFNPFDDGVRGRAAIVANWLQEPDAAGSWEARYVTVAVEGDVGVAQGRTRYLAPDGTLEREFDNIFVMHFDAMGRCTSFTEWYVQPRAS